MSENSNYSLSKEFINSIRILLVAILIKSGFFIFLIFFPSIGLIGLIAPWPFNDPFLLFTLVILVIFIIRAGRLLYITKSIKLILISIVVPLLIFSGIPILGASIYPDIKYLPLDIFGSAGFVAQKIDSSELSRSASNIEVNPMEICLVRRDLGSAYTGSEWRYMWFIEWRGEIKFPLGDESSRRFYNSVDTEFGAASFETAHGIEKFGEFDDSAPYSDGNFHKWTVFYTPDYIVSDKKFERHPQNSINFYLFTYTGNKKNMISKSYYTLAVPESIIQKVRGLGKIEVEVKPRRLTETERLVGTMCVPLNETK